MSEHRKKEIRAMVERMRQAYGVDKKDLPEIFGCKDGTINNWAHFGRMPYEQLEQCHKATGQSLDWLMYGIAPNNNLSQDLEAKIGETIHRVMEDGLDFDAISESHAGGAKSVANKMSKEVFKLFNTEQRQQKQNTR